MVVIPYAQSESFIESYAAPAEHSVTEHSALLLEQCFFFFMFVAIILMRDS